MFSPFYTSYLGITVAHNRQEPRRVHLGITLLAQLSNAEHKEDMLSLLHTPLAREKLCYTLRYPGAIVQVVPMHSQNPKQGLALKLCHLRTMV